MEIGEAIAQKGIKKQCYLETRGDVLLRNKEVFQFWKQLGMKYMFIGVEAIDEEGLARHRKRISLGKILKPWSTPARSTLRSPSISSPIRAGTGHASKLIRQWCMEIPEIVNISVNTPYPGTEIRHTETRRLRTRDYRLYDIQHAVLPTNLSLPEFYEELVKTQQVLNMKHLGWTALKSTAKIAEGHLLRGQTNFVKMLWKFNSVYNPKFQLADHRLPVKYEMSLPPSDDAMKPQLISIHKARRRHGRALDEATESFVNETRMGTTS